MIHERCVFQSRQQLANESVEQFARELKTLAIHCEYKEQTNEIARDRFVMGVRDQAVKQKLQLITDLSLDKAMTIARQHEQVKLQMREQQLEQDKHVAEARVSPSQRTAGRYPKPKDRSQLQYRYSMSRDRLTRKCERCGYAEHLPGGSCPALGQRCNKCNAKGHFASVCRSKRNTVNFERHKAYEVEREGTKPYRGKAESDGRGPFVGDIESDRTKPQVENGPSTAFLSVVDCTEKKDAWFVTLKVKRMRLRFKIDTGADVTIITKTTWLAMKDKPRLEPTAVRLNSVGGQLKAFDQFMAVTKHSNTVYRFNVIVIEGDKMTNLLSRDVAADMGLVCRLEQVDASGDDDARIGLMKTEPVTIKLKAGAESLCLTTARCTFPSDGRC